MENDVFIEILHTYVFYSGMFYLNSFLLHYKSKCYTISYTTLLKYCSESFFILFNFNNILYILFQIQHLSILYLVATVEGNNANPTVIIICVVVKFPRSEPRGFPLL